MNVARIYMAVWEIRIKVIHLLGSSRRWF